MSVAPPDHRFWDVTYDLARDSYDRGARYDEVKQGMVEELVRRAAKMLPGFADLEQRIVFKGGATPIDQERFTRSTGGACYGLEHSPRQSGPLRPQAKTHIRGLFLAGASTVYAHGVVGVMRGGVATAGAVLGRNLLDEIRAGTVFGDPARLPTDPAGWDPLDVCRIQPIPQPQPIA
jgi:phytoene dehydrogenase-like protein